MTFTFKPIIEPGQWIWYLSKFRAWKAQVSLGRYADSPEPLLIAHTKYGCRLRLVPQFSPVALLEMSAWVFKGGFCAYVIIPKIENAAQIRIRTFFKEFLPTGPTHSYPLQNGLIFLFISFSLLVNATLSLYLNTYEWAKQIRNSKLQTI